MIKLLGWEIHNVVYFNHAKVSVTKSPLTFIRGLNLDADPASPTSNAAGKTLLTSVIPNVFYFAPPLALKKKSKKDLLGKGSSIALTFRAEDGHKYKVTQFPSKYSIDKDGEDLEITRIPLAEKMIQDLFPLSQVLFYSTCYVSSQKSFPFQQDSDSDRLEYLIDMFRLDQYDRIREYFAQKLRGVKDDEVKLSVLEQRRGVLEKKVNEAKASTVTLDATALRSKVKSYEATIFELDKAVHGFNVTLNALSTLLETEEELDSLRSRYSYKESPAVVLKWLKEQRTLVRSYENYARLREQHAEYSASIFQELQSLVLPEEPKAALSQRKRKLAKALVTYQDELTHQTDASRRYREIIAAGKDVRKSLLSLGVDVDSQKVDLKADLSSQLGVYRATLKLEKLVHDHSDDATCPTCLSELDVANTRAAIRSAKKAIPDLEARIEAQEHFREYLSLKTKLRSLAFNPDSFGSLQESVATTKKEIAKVEDALSVWETEERLTHTLNSIKKPKVVNPPTDSTLTSVSIDESLELCSDILKHLEAKVKLTQAHPEMANLKKASAIKAMVNRTKASLASTETTLKGKRKALAAVASKLQKQVTASSELHMHEAELSTTVKEIDSLLPSLKVKRLLEVLLKAYGAKGLRTIAANEICGLLETNLNHYRGLVFAEPFSFSVRASELGLSLKVDRGNGKVSDVRSLSGAESNFFRLLFILSVLPLLPSDRRTNFLILDEPTSHADDVSRAIFRERFLPAIQQIVPHTFVISPHPDDYAPDSRELLVKKHLGVSEVLVS